MIQAFLFLVATTPNPPPYLPPPPPDPSACSPRASRTEERPAEFPRLARWAEGALTVAQSSPSAHHLTHQWPTCNYLIEAASKKKLDSAGGCVVAAWAERLHARITRCRDLSMMMADLTDNCWGVEVRCCLLPELAFRYLASALSPNKLLFSSSICTHTQVQMQAAAHSRTPVYILLC